MNEELHFSKEVGKIEESEPVETAAAAQELVLKPLSSTEIAETLAKSGKTPENGISAQNQKSPKTSAPEAPPLRVYQGPITKDRPARDYVFR